MSAATLAAWLHDLSPWVWRITPEFGVRWYGLSYLAGFGVAWLMLRMLARRRALAIAPERVSDVVLAAIVGVMVGGRLGYAFFYDPKLLYSFNASFPFWGLLKLNTGGMASHGGIAGVILATWWMARNLVDPALLARGPAALPTLGSRMRHVLDAMAMAVTPGMLLGRTANFVNGELLGEVVEKPAVMGGGAGPWWAVRFPQEMDDEWARRAGEITDRPPMLDEPAWVKLEGTLRSLGLVRPGEEFEATWARVVDRLQHGGREVARQIEPFVSARHPSQVYQAAAEGLVLGAVLWWIARRPRLPGVVGAWFMIVYGALRVVTELWRLPDAQLAVQRFAGLSRGQWLSVGMVAVGVVALALIRRWGGERVGGWARGSTPG